MPSVSVADGMKPGGPVSEIVPLGARSVTDTKENQTLRFPTTLTVCGCGETVS